MMSPQTVQKHKMTGTRAPTKVLVPVIIQSWLWVTHNHSNAMVTVRTKNFNTFSQENYDAIVARVQLHQITCTCGHCGSMRKYGHYSRTVWFLGYLISLVIQRIQCQHCGKTHAILLDILIPYSRIPLEDHRQIVVACEAGEDTEPIQEANYYIEDSMVRHIHRQYCRHWKQKLLSENISLLCDLTLECFRCFGRQFMQIRCTPNILFSPST